MYIAESLHLTGRFPFCSIQNLSSKLTLYRNPNGKVVQTC